MKKCTTAFTATSAKVYNLNDVITEAEFTELPEAEQANFTDATEEEVAAATEQHANA